MTRESVAAAILGAERITAICHENPDADTLGSALALRFAAERLGKQAEVVAADGVPPFLVGPAGRGRRPHARPRWSRTSPSSSTDRCPGPAASCATTASGSQRARIVNIDHHVSNDGTGVADTWIDADAAATCEMVAGFCRTSASQIDARHRDRPRRRHRPGHPHLLASECHASHAAGHGRPRRGRCAAVRAPQGDLRRQAVRHAGALGPHAGRASASAATAGSSMPRRRWRCSPRPAARRRPPRASSTCSPPRRTPTSPSSSRRPMRPPCGSSVRTTARADAVAITADVRWRRTCPRRRLHARRPAARLPWRACSTTASESSIAPMIGVVNLDKPVGPTSHDMVGLLRRLTGMRRIGHAGHPRPARVGRAADPGRRRDALQRGAHRAARSATRPSSGWERGARPTTPKGPIDAGRRAAAVTTRRSPAPWPRSVGTFDQRPPAFSARKLDGRTAHRAARAGDAHRRCRRGTVTVDSHRPARRHRRRRRLDARLDIRCGAGTYIRSIARDLGDALGCGGYLARPAAHGGRRPVRGRRDRPRAPRGPGRRRPPRRGAHRRSERLAPAATGRARCRRRMALHARIDRRRRRTGPATGAWPSTAETACWASAIVAERVAAAGQGHPARRRGVTADRARRAAGDRTGGRHARRVRRRARRSPGPRRRPRVPRRGGARCPAPWRSSSRRTPTRSSGPEPVVQRLLPPSSPSTRLRGGRHRPRVERAVRRRRCAAMAPEAFLDALGPGDRPARLGHDARSSAFGRARAGHARARGGDRRRARASTPSRSIRSRPTATTRSRSSRIRIALGGRRCRGGDAPARGPAAAARDRHPRRPARARARLPDGQPRVRLRARPARRSGSTSAAST